MRRIVRTAAVSVLKLFMVALLWVERSSSSVSRAD